MADVPTQFDVPPEGPERRYSETQLAQLSDYFSWEVEDAFSTRYGVEATWRNCLRMYEARPITPTKDVPIPNAPNIEVPIGAIAADAIYAEAVDLIFQISPIVSARAVDRKWVEHAKALQRFINFGIENEWDMRQAVTHTLCDDTQLGTGVYYIPWMERVKKTLTAQTIQSSGPRIRSLAPEHFLTPGAAPTDLNDARWVSARFFMTPAQLNVLAKYQQWDIEGVKAVAFGNSVRDTRQRYARTRPTGEETRALVEVLEGYLFFDIDDDGIAEDLLVSMDRVSRKIMRVRPNPYDRRRPFESMVYQPRPHLFNGIGLLEMLTAFEESATEIHNQRVLNMLLANCRVWARKEGTGSDTEEIWPGKNIYCADPKNDVVPLQMADVYTSSIQAETILAQYAERRSGVGDLGQGRSAALGSRTPGITALSAMQSVNKRFTPAFDAIRIATARAIQQCLYRYQERVLAGDVEVQTRIIRMLGPEDGNRVIEVLRNEDFDTGVLVELTAGSATANREADRQNAIMLANILGQYYSQLIQLMTLITAPTTPPELRTVGMKVIDAASEVVDRTIRTFDQVRDPEDFIIRAEDIIQSGGAQPAIPQQGIQQLLTMMGQQPGAQPGAPPQAPPNGSGPPTMQ